MDVFTALADPIRRDLLRRLAEGPTRVVDLTADHPVSRPAISRHLRVLADAGLVAAEDRGRERHYHLRAEPLAVVGALLDELTTPGPPIAGRHLDALETEVRRAARDRRRATAAGSDSPTRTEEQTA